MVSSKNKKVALFLFLPFHAAEHHRKDRNRSLTCLSTPAGHKLREFFNSRQNRAAQGSSAKRDQVIGCPFFGQAKKMNIEEMHHFQ